MKALSVVTFHARSVSAGSGGSEMGQSKDGKASDISTVCEAAEQSENTTGAEGNMSAAGMLFVHVHFSPNLGHTVDANTLYTSNLGYSH